MREPERPLPVQGMRARAEALELESTPSRPAAAPAAHGPARRARAPALSRGGDARGASSKDAVDRYLQDLDTTSRVTPEEEVLLANVIERAEREVYAIMVNAGLIAPHAEPTRGEIQDFVTKTWRRIDKITAAELRGDEAGAARAAVLAMKDLCVSPLDLASLRLRMLPARARSDTAKRELTRANLALVVAIAKNYVERGVPLADLIQEGNIGLMRAVEKFDPRWGVRFSTYGAWWLRQAMQRAVASQARTVRLPSSAGAALAGLDRAERELRQRLGREPEVSDVAELIGPEVDQLRTMRVARTGTVSLDVPLTDDGRVMLGDLLFDASGLAPDDAASLEERRERARLAIESLSQRERMVVRLRFGIGRPRSETLREVGTKLGLTRERIRQIEKQALDKLKKRLRDAD